MNSAAECWCGNAGSLRGCLRQVVELVVGCHLICSQWERVSRKIAEPSREPKVQQRGKGGCYTVVLSLGHTWGWPGGFELFH